MKYIVGLMLLLSLSVGAGAAKDGADYPEARPFIEAVPRAEIDAKVDAALDRAAQSRKHVILILGANWCHDSRALAGWFEQQRFAAMLAPRYEIVYVYGGAPRWEGQGVNQHLVKRFNGKKQRGTPYVMVLSPDGKLLNRKDARSWRNAASRSEDDIFRYFAQPAWQESK